MDSQALAFDVQPIIELRSPRAPEKSWSLYGTYQCLRRVGGAAAVAFAQCCTLEGEEKEGHRVSEPLKCSWLRTDARHRGPSHQMSKQGIVSFLRKFSAKDPNLSNSQSRQLLVMFMGNRQLSQAGSGFINLWIQFSETLQLLETCPC